MLVHSFLIQVSNQIFCSFEPDNFFTSEYLQCIYHDKTHAGVWKGYLNDLTDTVQLAVDFQNLVTNPSLAICLKGVSSFTSLNYLRRFLG